MCSHAPHAHTHVRGVHKQDERLRVRVRVFIIISLPSNDVTHGRATNAPLRLCVRVRVHVCVCVCLCVCVRVCV